MLGLCAVLSFFGIGFIYLCLDRVPVGYGLMLDRQSVVFSALFAWAFLDEPWLFTEAIATLMSLLGVLLVAQPPAVVAHIGPWLGMVATDSTSATVQPVEKLGILFGLLAALSAAGACECRVLLGHVSVECCWGM